MLPAGSRLRRREEFASVIRRGRRGGRSRLVVHLDRPTGGGAPRAGFVVSKAVGNAVVRHRVTRRLRHLVRPRLDQLPPGALLVVRALPPSATASSAELADDLDSGLRAARRKLSGAPVKTGG
ncbi:ribonuclease P protein component [Pseudonocardia lacus]|uniref:ribonuclease P protein component n=1 Tax=Pseudonocardia lacus TaxID=2835865 RepID=UPI001BDBE81D|nr:ribonuclease P protein component [Pseudonocardia lacus]